MISYSKPKLFDFYTLSQSKLLEKHTLHSGYIPIWPIYGSTPRYFAYQHPIERSHSCGQQLCKFIVTEKPVHLWAWGRGGGYSWDFLVGAGVLPVLQILIHFRPKAIIFHTRFQTWPLRNYVIITLIRLINDFLKSLRIHIFLLSFLFIRNWNDETFINSRSYLETHTRFQTSIFMLYVISASPFYCDSLHLYNIVIATLVQ